MHQHSEWHQVALLSLQVSPSLRGDQGRAAVQRDLKRLEEWADRNFMKFNMGRCRALHLGMKTSLKQCRQETDLWVTALWQRLWGPHGYSHLNMSQQCVLAAGKVGIWGCIHWSKASILGKVIIPLYTALLSSHLAPMCSSCLRFQENLGVVCRKTQNFYG